MRSALILGGNGFIGGHLAARLKREGYWVEVVDIKESEFRPSAADLVYIRDLRDPAAVEDVFHPVDEVFQLAANMGGAEWIFTGENDAAIMHDSALININVLEACKRHAAGKVFFSSSACVYPDFVQYNVEHCSLSEEMAVPARPDSPYGWEKLFSERLYDAYARNFRMSVRVGRIHNCFGAFGTWQHGREKAPAAICRKVAQAQVGQSIDVFGDGNQTRSFLHVSECVEGILRLMASDCSTPLNIGSSEMISINDLVHMVADIAHKDIKINHIPGPLGVRARTSNNDLIREKLGWAPSRSLRDGMEDLYRWIEQQVKKHALEPV